MLLTERLKGTSLRKKVMKSNKIDRVGGIIFVVVLLVFVFIRIYLEQQRPTPNSLQSQNPAHLSQQKITITAAPTISATPVGTAKEVTKEFYQFYFSSGNPLANGGYKTNTFLSPSLKNIMASQYNNGNTPLFCPQNKRAEVTVGKEKQTQTGLQETISSSSKDLYKVSLVNDKGKWLIDGVTCVY